MWKRLKSKAYTKWRSRSLTSFLNHYLMMNLSTPTLTLTHKLIKNVERMCDASKTSFPEKKTAGQAYNQRTICVYSRLTKTKTSRKIINNYEFLCGFCIFLTRRQAAVTQRNLSSSFDKANAENVAFMPCRNSKRWHCF